MLRIYTAIIFTLSACFVQAQDAQNVLDESAIDKEIEAALSNRVDEMKNTVGIIVGILTSEGRHYMIRGVGDLQTETEITEETIFEIGSLTKLLTAMLLADMVEAGEVALSDSIAKYLPDNMTVPSFNGRPITLVDLATHTSGLPFMPDRNLSSFLDMYDYLSTFELQNEPGTQYNYSNLGFGLLGHILSLSSGKSYEELLFERIFEPLGMRSTTITLSDSQRDRIATGYDSMGHPVGLTDIYVLAGAGAVRSTARDMLTLAEAQLGLAGGPLQPAMSRMLSIMRPMPRPNLKTHLGWIKIDNKTLFHIGATRGFASSFAVRPDIQRAVIVLSNSSPRVDTISLHGVMPESPIDFFQTDENP